MKVVITGGSGGVGSAFIEALAARPQVETVIATSRRNPPGSIDPKVTWHRLELGNEDEVRDWAG